MKKSHNPYFNRWFSAICTYTNRNDTFVNGHNPYFNRWFSAILVYEKVKSFALIVTILILIDGFLQLKKTSQKTNTAYVTILILIDGFLQ